MAATPAGKARAESPAEKGSQSKSATSCCNDCAKTSCMSEEIEAVPAESVCLERKTTAYKRKMRDRREGSALVRGKRPLAMESTGTLYFIKNKST